MKDAAFSSARLLALYERISDAEDAIPRLRRFVLDLAVRGKLVGQDSSDEPAAELLKSVARGRAQERRRKGTFTPVSKEEVMFSPPMGWTWARFGEVFHIRTGFAFKSPTYTDSGVLVFRVVNFDRSGAFDLSDAKYFPESLIDEKMANFSLEEGEILMVMVGGTIGKTTRVTAEILPALLNQNMWRIRSFGKSMSNDFEYLLIRTLNQQIENLTNSTHGHFAMGDFEQKQICIPPLAEQHRIVAKVDELMALCDQLEQARAGREAVRDRLTTASLARLTAPETDAQALPAEVGTGSASSNATNTSTFQSHARFALQSLPTLTTPPDQIKTLRQTILNLAVRGKLVEQNMADEPATELLRRIREWQKASISQKKIRAPRKPLAKVGEDDQPYPLPAGWAFARLGEIIYIQSGDGLTAANMMDGPYPVFGGNGINGHHDCHNVQKPTLVIGRVGYYCGSVHVTPENAWVTDNAFITHFSEDEILLSFLVLLLNGTNLKEDENATAQPVISGSKIYPIIVGLPPLAEQHRIVAKVDALMALCDQLEASLTTTATTRSKLLNALLHEALEPVAETADA